VKRAGQGLAGPTQATHVCRHQRSRHAGRRCCPPANSKACGLPLLLSACLWRQQVGGAGHEEGGGEHCRVEQGHRPSRQEQKRSGLPPGWQQRRQRQITGAT
jgi:hypothetical protein